MNEVLFYGIKVNELLERIGQLIDSKIGVLPMKNQEEQSDYITRSEAAKLLKVSLPTLHDWSKRGLLSAYKIQTRVLYRKSEVQQSISKLQVFKHKKGGVSYA